ncbi:DUF389 domain-containing protein [Flavobacteriaceae bacterium S0825]|uniref:DUF389 domain-containing protein n=1 Tax=Gaetbulibacter sp. S0825 TaxID=2720084 RepID=UPI0014322B97|nr:DUF389 domain-containing protein [Gaetbulibacter sp. S0825]MCK0110439.1 DUF389 domain-containing protein [Flavobacteriaceae bacterium S0825]NIX66068.1 DUF389 domain-containing protein [Gaetbulibacter sp. S0825]
MEENKFNFTDDESQGQQKVVEEQKEAIVKDAKGLVSNSKQFLFEIFSFRKDTDRDATIDAIKADIPFKGATAWILICSIMVASVGLNANSTAVVIGAMLISPLMGPILGVGMSIAINDIDTLRKSLINLAVMIVLSLLTAFLFFWLFPLSEDTSELLGRTRPDIRDVLIAFFGGLALIIARTKKGTIASVIFGVAIATALMPPLCTAGYGLAKGNWSYFGGAMYLFSINTVFIALATFLVLKLLRFPMLRYANSAKRRRIAKLAGLLALIAMIPAGWTFYNVWGESKRENDYKQFIANEIDSNESLWLQREKLDPDNNRITLYFNGEITEATESDLRNELNKYSNIKDFDLVINGNKNVSAERLMDLYDKSLVNIEQRDSLLFEKQKELDSVKAYFAKKSNILDANDFTSLAKDAKIQFTDLQYFGYAKMLASSDFRKADTIAIANVKWNTSLTDSIMTVKEVELSNWLKQELKIDNVIIKRD